MPYICLRYECRDLDRKFPTASLWSEHEKQHKINATEVYSSTNSIGKGQVAAPVYLSGTLCTLCRHPVDLQHDLLTAHMCGHMEDIALLDIRIVEAYYQNREKHEPANSDLVQVTQEKMRETGVDKALYEHQGGRVDELQPHVVEFLHKLSTGEISTSIISPQLYLELSNFKAYNPLDIHRGLTNADTRTQGENAAGVQNQRDLDETSLTQKLDNKSTSTMMPDTSAASATPSGYTAYVDPRPSTTKQPKIFPCPHCSQTFEKPYYLRWHLRIDAHEKRYTCRICDKKFAHQHDCRLHEDVDHPKELHHLARADEEMAGQIARETERDLERSKENKKAVNDREPWRVYYWR